MKLQKNKKTVIVHSGNFHADDVFSVAVLSLYLKNNIKVIRTREEKFFKSADYVMDVGGVYDPKKNRFDHHQIGGSAKRENGIAYAAFGLVWKKFGHIISGSKKGQEIIDKKLVQIIDAADNGFTIEKSIIPGVQNYSLSNYVLYVNMDCNDQKAINKSFNKMVIFAKSVLEMEIRFAKLFIKEEKNILREYDKSVDKRLIILENDYSNWSNVLIEKDEPLFVVKPSPDIKAWKVYALKVKGEEFKNRMDLPIDWAGKKDRELINITGVTDASYCHHSRFMVIAHSKEGAITLAKLALGEIKINK